MGHSYFQIDLQALIDSIIRIISGWDMLDNINKLFFYFFLLQHYTIPWEHNSPLSGANDAFCADALGWECRMASVLVGEGGGKITEWWEIPG